MAHQDLPDLHPLTGPTSTATAAVVRGVKTSECWVSVLAILLPGVLVVIDPQRLAVWSRSNGWVGGIVAAAYTLSRSYVKSSGPEADR